MTAVATIDEMTLERRNFRPTSDSMRTTVSLERIYWDLIDQKCEKLGIDWHTWLQEMFALHPEGHNNFALFLRSSIIKDALSRLR